MSWMYYYYEIDQRVKDVACAQDEAFEEEGQREMEKLLQFDSELEDS